ncbi:hypothetical protein [Frondihabitans sp. VKM Ac-2883]|jgi:uncharacterized protein YukE|uniref:hypothetical protein n=1 Tax=Frondihabitans sp. VKM Ac-2883 TaxID=2783823 RepID=UPI00188C6A61|nr:hypothetical protein [Frondihabitans sp. VKM Ac-2883]MBF4577757.1 hypothetical protein [Frondihabitans sp. VKM Ac-2883]
MKFAMGADTLGVLGKKTGGASQDLGSQVKALLAAAEPLQGKFNGQGRAAFDRFKGQSDEVAGELNASLAAVLQGIGGMNTAFGTGDQQMADEQSQAAGSVNFDSARFGAGH